MAENAENGKVVAGKVISTCHHSLLDFSCADGIHVWWCRVQECDKAIVRINPCTGVEEFLDGRSPWTIEDNLRPVIR